MKFDKIGDFNYMIYTKRTLRNETLNAAKDREM